MWWWVCHTQLWHSELRGAGLGLEALYWEKHSASLLLKVGRKKTQPKQPAVEFLPSLHFRAGKDALPSRATWSTATRAGGFAAGSLAPDILTSSFNPEEGGGKLLRLPALCRAEVSRNHSGYRKQMAFCCKCKTLRRKSVQITSVDN